MSASKDKYRGSVEYFLVYAELIQAARFRGLTTYQALAQLMGLPPWGAQMGRAVGQMLGEISEEEARYGRPMLSAVCVGVSGVPGPGFYSLARYMGKLHSEDKEAERRFWEAELQAVYQAWARQFKPAQDLHGAASDTAAGGQWQHPNR